MGPEPKSAEEAVEVFLERRRAGESLDPAAFAAGHPGLEPDLSAALEGLFALERTSGADGDLALSVPDRIGPYRILRGIGRGGMGVVYEAVEEALGRRVALKVLPPELIASSSARRRFRREAELASRLDHSGIATVYGAGVEGERPWIAMRFVEGQTLARAIARAREDGASSLRLFPDSVKEREVALRVAALLARVARALHAAHEQGVVHRDIKPSNVIVQPDGSPVLLDFGLAIEEASDGGSLTRTGEAPGTPAYLAPETVAGEIARPDAQSDVYALGVMLYECLALRRPYDAPTLSALYRAILSASPPGLRARNPAVPRDLAVVAATAMERDRTRRYRSAEALALDLEACVAGRPIAARPVPLHGRILRWTRREPRLALAIAASIVIAIGGFAWVSAAKSEAEANGRIATQKADDVLSLSAIQDLRDLEDRADALWPADPARIQAYRVWLADARLLVEGRAGDPAKGVKRRASLAEHEGKLAEIRLRAKPLSPDQVEADRKASPRLAEWERERAKLTWTRRMLGEEPWPPEAEDEAQDPQKTQLASSMKQLENEVALWKADGDRAKQVEEETQLGQRVAELASIVSERRTYDFEDGEDRWWHAQLAQLVSDLKSFTDEKTGLFSEGTSVQHGWGIAKRLEFAASIEERSVRGPEAAERWTHAIAAIAASPKYSGLRMEPQLGLLPIGPDPASGLWEFSHLASGEDFEPAERGDDGRLVLREGMGIVLVLIPGGTFLMGAQSTDSTGRNYDAQAHNRETPLQEVTLSHYFLSKYEMTQGQWLRMTGRNPSAYTSATTYPSWNRAGEQSNLLHPVEQVDWLSSTETCARSGLVLPTEAQWERACRAGTDSPFWSGGNDESLRFVANVGDAWAKAHGGEGLTGVEAWEDGNSVHASVGSYAANAYGLHDVHGNVWEWCRDGFGDYTLPCSDGDGERRVPGARMRAIRGGSFMEAARFARSAHRGENTPEQRYQDLGLRPARGITGK